MDLREKSFADTVRDIAAEGVVLLENNGVLPLTEDRKRIALYGAGAVLTRKGGTGSGDVSVEHVTNIVEALEEAGLPQKAGCRTMKRESRRARRNVLTV